MCCFRRPSLLCLGGDNWNGNKIEDCKSAGTEDDEVLQQFNVGNSLPCLGRSFVRGARSFAISFPGHLAV